MVQLAFQIQSDGGLEFGGWTLDDVALMAPATPDNRLGISDFTVTPSDEGLKLAWTNPKHAPLTGIRLVRGNGVYPSGPFSGELLFADDEPELGKKVKLIDRAPPGGGAVPGYAVYATDGEHWLSWTVPGWNADSEAELSVGTGTTGGTSLDTEGESAGCGFLISLFP